MKIEEKNNTKFRLKEDWTIQIDFLDIKEKQVVFKKGHIFEPIDGIYIIESTYISTKLTLEQMENAQHDGVLMFEKVEEDFKLNTFEIDKLEDEEIKNWRIQLDVKTSFNNLKKIEKFLNENIPDYL